MMDRARLLSFDAWLRRQTSITLALEKLVVAYYDGKQLGSNIKGCGENDYANSLAVVRVNNQEKQCPRAIVKKYLPGCSLVSRQIVMTIAHFKLLHARNWFNPACLSPKMLLTLRQTTIPFGSAIKGLSFSRCNLTSSIRHSDDKSADLPLIAHRSILTLVDGTVFCYLEEDYLPSIKQLINGVNFEKI